MARYSIGGKVDGTGPPSKDHRSKMFPGTNPFNTRWVPFLQTPHETRDDALWPEVQIQVRPGLNSPLNNAPTTLLRGWRIHTGLVHWVNLR